VLGFCLFDEEFKQTPASPCPWRYDNGVLAVQHPSSGIPPTQIRSRCWEGWGVPVKEYSADGHTCVSPCSHEAFAQG